MSDSAEAFAVAVTADVVVGVVFGVVFRGGVVVLFKAVAEVTGEGDESKLPGKLLRFILFVCICCCIIE